MTRISLVTNPTIEINEGGWDNPASRCTLSASTDHAWTGTKSLKVVHNTTQGTTSQSGTGWPNFPVTAGQTLTFSAYVWVPTGSPRVRLEVQGSATATGTTSSLFDQWQRLSVTTTPGINGSVYFYILNWDTTAPGTMFYMDGALLEAGPELLPYFDGDSPYSAWSGTAHGSTSTYEVPARTNLFTNPSAEIDTIGWSAVSGTIARHTSAVYETDTVVRMSFTNPTAALAGWFGGTVTGLTIGQTYTASLMVRRVSNGPAVQLVVNDGTDKFGQQSSVTTGDWEMMRMTFVAAAATATVGLTNVTATSTTFQVSADWLTVELGSTGSPFAGDKHPLDGYTYNWTGAKHASTSIAKPERVNRCINPSFGSGTRYGWNGTTNAGTYSIDTTEGILGNKNCFKAVPTSTGIAILIRGTSGSGNTAEMCPVTPGKTYTVSGYVKSSQLSSFRMDVRGANSSGVLTAIYPSVSYENNNTEAGGQWVRFRNTVNVAAGDAYLVPEFNGSISGGATYYFDGFMIEESGRAGRFFDGEYQNDWTTNAWIGTAFQSTSKQVLSPITSPTVIQTYTGAVSLSTTHTVFVGDTPSSSEVLILLSKWSTSAANPPASGVSGLGATWTQIPGGTDYVTAWMGTGATSSGTVTVTGTAITSGRSAKLIRLSGVTAMAEFRRTTATTDKHFATPNQIAIGVSQANTGAAILGERNFPEQWVDDGYSVSFDNGHVWNTSWMRPVGQDMIYNEGFTWGGIVLVGSPLANTKVKRRNGLYRAGFESASGASISAMPTSAQTAVVHSGKAAVGGVSTGTNATVTMTGTLGYAPVMPNKEYTVSAWVYCSASRSVSIAPQWKTNSQAAATTATPASTVVPASTWTQISWTGLSHYNVDNYGAYYAGVQIVFSNTVGDSCYVDEWQLDEGPVPLPFLDYSYTPGANEFLYVAGDRLIGSAGQEYYMPSAYPTTVFGPITMSLKLRQADAWVTYPGTVKVRDADAWVLADPKYWNGTQWVAVG